jgi:putative DNA primase/helicase
VETLADFHPEHSNRYSFTDMGDGYLFADWFKNAARYVPERKMWFCFNGKMWEPDVCSLAVMERCKQLADNLLVYALSLPDDNPNKGFFRQHAEKWQSRRARETILKEAASVYPVSFNEFDRDPFLFNCLNGTLDLRTREFHRHTAKDMLSKVSGVSYDPEARCDRWERFIGEVMNGDAACASYLQKALGYALTGDTSRECFFILYGPTSRNGKGTTMETVMQLMGDYGKAAQPDTITQRDKSRGGAPSEDIARLSGSRFVNISEPDKRMVLSAALVKTLTGSDTINARFLNENSFDFKPQFKLFLNTNHLPACTDTTVFSSGRCKVVPFARHFSDAERDPGLKAELSQPENLSGILNWCTAGLWMMQETGFDEPLSVTAATADYRQDNDKISRFISDEMIQGGGCEVQTSAAFERYREWCGSNGFQSGSIKLFLSDIAGTMDTARKRPAGGGSPTTMIVGWKLQPKTAGIFSNNCQ